MTKPTATSRKRRVSPKSKAGSIEAMARRNGDERLLAAAEAWRGLAIDAQRVLVAEAADTRSAELLAAYPGVMSVGYGFRQRGELVRPARKAGGATDGASKRGGVVLRDRRTIQRDEPCVVLVVQRKWSKDRKRRTGELPKFLLGYCEGGAAGEGRARCILPIDVRQINELRASPRVRQVTSRLGGVPPGKLGYIACAVEIPGQYLAPGGVNRFGLTCRHVLDDAGRRVAFPGETSSWGGLLARPCGRLVPPDQGFSFDAALVSCDPESNARLTEAIGQLPLASIDPNPNIPAQTVQFVLRDGDVLTGDLAGAHMPFQYITYLPGEPVQPLIGRVLEYVIRGGRSTVKGDSGCLVVREEKPTEFVGIHIGGVDNTQRVFVVCAFDLFHLNLWAKGLTGKLSLAADA